MTENIKIKEKKWTEEEQLMVPDGNSGMRVVSLKRSMLQKAPVTS